MKLGSFWSQRVEMAWRIRLVFCKQHGGNLGVRDYGREEWRRLSTKSREDLSLGLEVSVFGTRRSKNTRKPGKLIEDNILRSRLSPEQLSG